MNQQTLYQDLLGGFRLPKSPTSLSQTNASQFMREVLRFEPFLEKGTWEDRSKGKGLREPPPESGPSSAN